jgi:hypothetical protein
MSKGHGKYLDTAALSGFRKHPIGWVLEDAKTQYGVDILQDRFGMDYRAAGRAALLHCVR